MSEEREKFIEIKVYQDCAMITSEQELGDDVPPQKTVKTVKIEDFIKAFSEAELDYSSPILPPNCVRYKEKGNQTIVMLLHEETTFTASCGSETYENCIRPNVLMVYYLNKDENAQYSISRTEAYGIKDSPNLITANTVLFGLPFPNIGTDGWVCWGSNSISGKFKSLVGLKAYVDRVFNSPFNNHLFNGGSLHPFGIHSNHDLFRYLQGKDHFPYEILENLGNRRTLGSL